MGFLGRLLKTRTGLPKNTIVIVSGLPRSGTSMMMKMLEAGGMALLTDHLRTPDEDNPKGYYEFERVKQLPKGDTEWLSEAEGKAVKVISALLEHLPPHYQYKIIFMNRNLKEVLLSQRKMLLRRGEDPDKVSDRELEGLFTKHLRKVKAWVQAQPNMDLLEVDYNRLLADPLPYVRQVNAFLGGWLDEEAMAQVVDPTLYRNRASDQSGNGMSRAL